MKKDPSSFELSGEHLLRGREVRDLGIPGFALLILMKALYARDGWIPDHPDEVARALHMHPKTVKASWHLVRQEFFPMSGGLIDNDIEVDQQRKMKLREKRTKAANSLWNQRRADASALQVQSKCIASAFADDKERAHDAGTGACAVEVLNIQKKNTTTGEPEIGLADRSIPAELLDDPAPAPKARKVKPTKAEKPLSPKVQRELAIENTPWSQADEAELAMARQEYPTNQVRTFRDGTQSRCQVGPPGHARNAWKRIKLDHGLTSREIKAAFFAYLGSLERDAQGGLVTFPVNFLSFFAEDRGDFEDWIEPGRELIRQTDLEAMGAARA